MKMERGQRKFSFLPDDKPKGFEKIYAVLEDIGVPRSHCGVYRALRNDKLLFVHVMFGNRENDPVNIRLVINRDCSYGFIRSLFQRHIDRAASKYRAQSGIPDAPDEHEYGAGKMAYTSAM